MGGLQLSFIHDIYVGGAGEGGSNPDVVDRSTPLAKHCNLSSIPAVCSSTCCIVSCITGTCCGLYEGWACDKCGVPDDIIDVAVEATIGVFLALSSF